MRYDDRERRHSSELLFKSLSLIVVGGLATAITVGGVAVWRSGDRVFATFNRWLSSTLVNPIQQSTPRVDVQTVVIQQIREMSELTTATFTMQAVVPTSRDTTLAGWVVGKTKLLYIAHGEVKAGVDLSQLSAKDVQVTNGSMQIQLPPPRVLDSKIDITRSQVYDYDRGLLGLGPDVAPELQSLAQQEALKQVVATACNEGLLQRASDRATLVVTQLLHATGHQQVSVTTQPPTPETCATASTPVAPAKP